MTTRRLIVDAMNVIGSRPDGWWRDRKGAVRRFVERLQGFAKESGDEITVVIDGRPLSGLAEGVRDGLRVAYARRSGRDAADDRIVEIVAEDREPTSLRVVTSDRGLATRVAAHGAQTEGAGAFLSELDRVTPRH
jgi:predicted RNA-binding protein with PIN domain